MEEVGTAALICVVMRVVVVVVVVRSRVTLRMMVWCRWMTGEVVMPLFPAIQVVEDWNVTPGDGHLYFTFRPPWVSVRVTDTFFSLHPEQRVFQDPRLKKIVTSSTFAPSTDLMLQSNSSLGMGANGAAVKPDLS